MMLGWATWALGGPKRLGEAETRTGPGAAEKRKRKSEMEWADGRHGLKTFWAAEENRQCFGNYFAA
jgi:hypothetical protein